MIAGVFFSPCYRRLCYPAEFRHAFPESSHVQLPVCLHLLPWDFCRHYSCWKHRVTWVDLCHSWRNVSVHFTSWYGKSYCISDKVYCCNWFPIPRVTKYIKMLTVPGALNSKQVANLQIDRRCAYMYLETHFGREKKSQSDIFCTFFPIPGSQNLSLKKIQHCPSAPNFIPVSWLTFRQSGLWERSCFWCRDCCISAQVSSQVDWFANTNLLIEAIFGSLLDMFVF